MNTPKGYVDPTYLHSTGNFIDNFKKRTYECMQLRAGDKVLDVGCGPGVDTIALSQIVGPTGQVVGVDYDEAMVATSEKYAVKEGVSAWVMHKLADATSLPFDAGYFDSCRSERLFQHLPNPAQALQEMTRVTKIGGTVVVLDTDWGTLSRDTTEVDIERRLSRFLAEHMLTNGYSGRQLYRLFKEQGLRNVSFEVLPFVVTSYAFLRQILTADRLEAEALAQNSVTEDELSRLQKDGEWADGKGVFFSSGCMMLVSGQKTG
jgi:ubiquinone/menaquinone biosynthesis C-methylase UbiE